MSELQFERKAFRRQIGRAVLAVQDAEGMAGTPAETVVPEIMAALLSLAAYIGAHNAHMSGSAFMKSAKQAAREQWKDV